LNTLFTNADGAFPATGALYATLARRIFTIGRLSMPNTADDLFEQFEKAKDNAGKEKLAQEICTELTVHATIEEEIFYLQGGRGGRS
jgi:hypothetical protein